MGYNIEAAIGPTALLVPAAREIAAARVVPLEQGLSLLPVTDELVDALGDGSTAPLGFWKLPGGFDGQLASWSASGELAYVEADYFGGVGEQRAAVWADGRLALGPLHLGEGLPMPTDGSPISRALRYLGAVRGDYFDEFEAVGLNRHRQTSKWLG